MDASTTEKQVEAVRFSRDVLLATASLSRFQKVLLLSDGSVTELLCIYTGREIATRKIEQYIRSGKPPEILDVDEEAPLLHRRILLTDRGIPQVYAESVFVHHSLSPETSRQLQDSDTPIGKLWRQERTEMYREIVDIRLERDAAVARHFELPDDDPLLSRTYVLWQKRTRLGTITEKFPYSSFRA